MTLAPFGIETYAFRGTALAARDFKTYFRDGIVLLAFDTNTPGHLYKMVRYDTVLI